MFSKLRNLFTTWSLPKDPNFKFRDVAKQRLGHLLVVELGANDYVIIHDMLAKIQLEETDDATKSRELIGLRYMALAMSLRTKRGRIPFDWQDENDLLYLATLPQSKVLPVLDAIASLSGIEWITPNYSPKESDNDDVEVEPPSKKELEQNPS